MNAELEFKLNHIPKQPGVYLFKDQHDRVIYVGKAKNLFNRVHSYFNNIKLTSNHSYKTNKLVDHIANVDFIVVANENESLILESNLIQKYKPQFNILLKENSGYPYIVVTKETHPRLLYLRDYKKIKGKYYGPFAATSHRRYDIYDLLLRLFPLRKCSHLHKEKCLYYDIGQCLGPCINHIEQDQYRVIGEQIDAFFKGDTHSIIKTLQAKEKTEANTLDFEGAKRTLDLINGIKEISHQQNINLHMKTNSDVVGYFVKDNLISIVIFSYANGKLFTKHQQIGEIHGEINDTLTDYLMQFYYKSFNIPQTCYVNVAPASMRELAKVLNVHFINPVKGLHKTIMQTAAHNAKTYYELNYLVYQKKQAQTVDAFNELAKMLSLDNLTLINVFDMSNLFGNDKVGGMIALENGVYNKNLYRKFIIKDLNANSDYAYMSEVIKRQYTRVLKNNEALPNLIIVDGGIIQVNAAIKALKEINLQSVIPVIGLAKNSKHQTDAIVFPNHKQIKLDHQSSLYMYLFNMQEEIHRYTINFFRQKSKSSAFKSVLNEIPGLGEKSVNKLLQRYENVANIKIAPVEELTQYVKLAIAKEIKKRLNHHD
ncbi:MAG: excinuclease ABC subunit UvrC [Mycoplasmataceae bacterium]|jgi:excinuclease ABC subunit C|nr:excinuclease ABC subunit UvrC [Mycoplasmataceae bacterium]